MEEQFIEGETWQNVCSYMLGENILLRAQLHAQKYMLMALMSGLSGQGKVDIDQMESAYQNSVRTTYDSILATHPLITQYWKDYLKDNLVDIPGVIPPVE